MGRAGPVWQAIGGVDLALWDLAGKRAAVPVAWLLGEGTPRSAVPAYASGVGPDAITALCERALELGLRAVKVRVGFGFDTDLETLRHARAVCGDRVRLFADANQAWDLGTATRMSKLLRDNGVEWVEEPFAGDRTDELGELVRTTGENVYGVDEFRDRLCSPAAHLVQPDVSKTGGLTVAATITREAGETA